MVNKLHTQYGLKGAFFHKKHTRTKGFTGHHYHELACRSPRPRKTHTNSCL